MIIKPNAVTPSQQGLTYKIDYSKFVKTISPDRIDFGINGAPNGIKFIIKDQENKTTTSSKVLFSLEKTNQSKWY